MNRSYSFGNSYAITEDRFMLIRTSRIFELAHCICICHSFFSVAILRWGDIAINTLPKSFSFSVLLSGVIGTVSQVVSFIFNHGAISCLLRSYAPVFLYRAYPNYKQELIYLYPMLDIVYCAGGADYYSHFRGF